MCGQLSGKSGYVITCNGKVIVAGTPSIVAHVFQKLSGAAGAGNSDYTCFMETVGTSLKGSAVLEGDKLELMVFGAVVATHVHGERAVSNATEMDLYKEWLSQVGQQAATEPFEAAPGLLDDFRRGTSPAEGLLADRLRGQVLER